MRLQRTFTGYFLFTEISSLLRWNREFNASLWANTWEYFVKTGKYWRKANWALICKRTLDINRFLIFLGYKSFWSITRPKEFKMLDCFFSKVQSCFVFTMVLSMKTETWERWVSGGKAASLPDWNCFAFTWCPHGLAFAQSECNCEIKIS